MNNNETFFNSVTELAKHLGISRKTLYERAKRDGIELNGSYTQEELNLLRLKKSKNVTDTKVDNHSRNETQNKHNETELVDVLTAQIVVLEQDKDRLYSELESRNKHIDELNKQVDQAQQLQLLAENRLSEEHQLRIETENLNSTLSNKKSFWKRLFG